MSISYKIATSVFYSKGYRAKYSLYSNMLRVLAYSVKKNTGNVLNIYECDLSKEVKETIDANFISIPKTTLTGKVESSSEKVQSWLEIIKQAKEPTIILDADTLVNKDPVDVFDLEFDIACTAGRGGAVNLGFLAVRPSQHLLDFANSWYLYLEQFMKNKIAHQSIMRSHGAADQYTFCMMRKKSTLNIIEVPWRIYNLHDDWTNPD